MGSQHDVFATAPTQAGHCTFMLKWRLILGSAIILALAGLCWLDAQCDLPGVALMPLLLVLTLLATQEVLRLARSANLRPAARPVYFGNLMLVLAQWFPALNLYLLHKLVPGREFGYLPHVDLIYAGSQSAMWAFALGVLAVFLAEMRRFERPGGTMANIAAGVFCLVYVGLMCTFAVQLRVFWGVGALAAWIVTVKMGDIGAYTVGRLIGRTKLSPTISPGKTVEGAMGAIVFAIAGAWIGFSGSVPLFGRTIVVHGITVPWFSDWLLVFPPIVQLAPPSAPLNPGAPGGWLIFGLAMGIAGIVGDLAESLLKRDVGVKDSSSWMPGFGGVLDILDSLLLSAPVAWLCWALGVVGVGQGT
jgi:phosphatidate cytidylyltransferase